MTESQEKALTLFRNKFEAGPSLFGDSQAYEYMKLLKELRLIDEASTVANSFLKDVPELTQYINTYGYLLYNVYIDIPEEKIRSDIDTFYQQAHKIIEITKPEKYSPFFATINKTIRIITGSPTINYDHLYDMLNHLNPDDLSTLPFINNAGKEFESKQERYYRLMVRALYETKQFEKCIETASKALSTDLKWHFNAQQWIAYYRALSLVEMKNFEEARTGLIALKNRLRGVDIDLLIYNIYKENNDIKEANIYILYSFFEKGYGIENIDVYKQLLNAACDTKDDELITLIDQFIFSITKEFEVAYTPLKEQTATDSYALYDTLYNKLMSKLDLFIERKKGTIIYYNEEKTIGTIIDDETQERIYFRQSDFVYDENVQRRDQVSYTPLVTYNNKKRESSNKAILILITEQFVPYNF